MTNTTPDPATLPASIAEDIIGEIGKNSNFTGVRKFSILAKTGLPGAVVNTVIEISRAPDDAGTGYYVIKVGDVVLEAVESSLLSSAIVPLAVQIGKSINLPAKFVGTAAAVVTTTGVWYYNGSNGGA